MELMRNWIHLLVFLLVIVPCSISTVNAASDFPLLRPITIPSDSKLADAIVAVHRASGLPVLAEIPQVQHRVKAEIRSREFPEAFEAVSATFHLYGLYRSRSVAFQRRYAVPQEIPDLELEELTAAAADIERLIEPFARGWDGRAETRDQNSFFATLTTEQITAMRGEGLPLGRLSAEQQATWLRINNWNSFGHENLTSRRAYHILSTWQRCELANLVLPTAVPGRGTELRTNLWFRFPDLKKGMAGISIAPGVGATNGASDPKIAGAGEELRDRMPLPAAFQVRLKGSDGETTLGNLVDLIAQTTKREIEVPRYARDRRLIAAVSGARAADVLTALEDLYGWFFRPENRRYLLGRFPPSIPPRNPEELHRRLRIAIPPPLFRVWSEEAVNYRQEREILQRALIHKQLAAEKGDQRHLNLLAGDG